MRIATIDIGTNTVLLLIVDIDDAGRITTLAYEQRTPRLGKDVDAQKIIGKAAFERVAADLREYKTICSRYSPERIVAVGTSAVRDAKNSVEFITYIKAETGIEVEIVSGEEEAKLAYFGALSGYQGPEQLLAVIDIGGGSTEITMGTRKEIHHKISLDIGSVRMTERFLRHDPPTLSELKTAEREIAASLRVLPEFDFSRAVVIGVAGTAASLATIDQGLKEFRRERITNYHLTKPAVNNLLKKLVTMKVREILTLSTVTEGRADILTAGTLILHTFMQRTDIKEIIVSERGVRYGLALREWQKTRQM